MMQFMGWMVIPFSIKCIFLNVQKWSSEWLDFILTLLSLSFCKQNFFFAIHFFFHRNYKNSNSFQKWLPHRSPRRPFMDQKRPKSLKPPYSISYSSSSYKLVRPPAAKRWIRPQLLEDTQCPHFQESIERNTSKNWSEICLPLVFWKNGLIKLTNLWISLMKYICT